MAQAVAMPGGQPVMAQPAMAQPAMAQPAMAQAGYVQAQQPSFYNAGGARSASALVFALAAHHSRPPILAGEAALQQWFAMVDTDRSGQISAKELQQVSSMEAVLSLEVLTAGLSHRRRSRREG